MEGIKTQQVRGRDADGVAAVSRAILLPCLANTAWRCLNACINYFVYHLLLAVADCCHLETLCYVWYYC
jgi:hypothetical protein